MRLGGIDAGLHPGIGIIEPQPNGLPVVVFQRKIKTDTTASLDDRLVYLFREIAADFRRFDVVAFSIEDQENAQRGAYFRDNDQRSDGRVMAAYGAALMVAAAYGIRWFSATPRQGRIALMGRGAGKAGKNEKAATKPFVLRMPAARGVKLTEHTLSKDAADAIAQAVYCSQQMRFVR